MKRKLIWLLVSIWTLTIGSGFWVLMVYANTPGEAANSKKKWPIESKIKFDQEQPTLIVFIHPECPCSKATVGELENLMPSVYGKVKVYVGFLITKEYEQEWIESSLWQRTQSIPGINLFWDFNGKEMNIFGANTSGQTFLYDSSGSLQFSGGITPGRGEMGENDGVDAIVAFVNNGPQKKSFKDQIMTLVFGCSLKRGLASEK